VVFKTWVFRAEEFQMGGLHGKYAVATCCTLGTILPSTWRQGKAKKTCVETADRRTIQMLNSGNSLENKR